MWLRLKAYTEPSAGSRWQSHDDETGSQPSGSPAACAVGSNTFRAGYFNRPAELHHQTASLHEYETNGQSATSPPPAAGLCGRTPGRHHHVGILEESLRVESDPAPTPR